MSPTMTVRQRLLAALARKEPDRLPIELYGVYPYNPENRLWSRPSYQPLLDFAREHADPFCTWILDQGTFYARMPTHSRVLEGGLVEEVIETPRGPLTRLRTTITGVRWTTKFYLQDDEDIQRFLSIPYAPVRPDIKAALELEKAVGERALMFVPMDDALAEVAELLPREDFYIRCLRERATVKKLVDKVFEHFYDYVHYLLDHGPRSFYLFGGAEYVAAPLLSPAYFDEFIVGYSRRLIDLIHQHGSWAGIHCHGRLDGILERIADTGADALHPMEAPPMGDVSLAEVKRRVGDRLCLVGNIQVGELISHSHEEIDRRVKEAVRDGAPGGGLILSVTASPFEEELTPHTAANYQQVVESGRKHSHQ